MTLDEFEKAQYVVKKLKNMEKVVERITDIKEQDLEINRITFHYQVNESGFNGTYKRQRSVSLPFTGSKEVFNEMCENILKDHKKLTKELESI